jgi:hypothetical protein
MTMRRAILGMIVLLVSGSPAFACGTLTCVAAVTRKCSAQEKGDRRTNNDDSSYGYSDHGKSEQQ